MKKTVITISRSYGSSGHDIGEMLADELNIPFYDKNLIAVIAEKNGMNKEILMSLDEKPTNNLLLSKIMESQHYFFGGVGRKMIGEQIYEIQKKTICDIAENENCIIVGRCADVALQDANCNVLSVFIDAPIEARIKKIMKRHNVTSNEATNMINKMDKERSSFYNYYANKKWGHCGTYTLAIDSSKFGIENSVEIIKGCYEKLMK